MKISKTTDVLDITIKVLERLQDVEKERQANLFAMELLMPSLAVQYCIMELNLTDIEDLALKFDVSERIMQNRLRQLGWLSN